MLRTILRDALGTEGEEVLKSCGTRACLVCRLPPSQFTLRAYHWPSINCFTPAKRHSTRLHTHHRQHPLGGVCKITYIPMHYYMDSRRPLITQLGRSSPGGISSPVSGEVPFSASQFSTVGVWEGGKLERE